MTKDEVNELARAYLLGAMPIVRADENGPVVTAVIDNIKQILDLHMPEIRQAAKRYLDDDDQDAFLTAMLPCRYQIWYEAYSPYSGNGHPRRKAFRIRASFPRIRLDDYRMVCEDLVYLPKRYSPHYRR